MVLMLQCQWPHKALSILTVTGVLGCLQTASGAPQTYRVSDFSNEFEAKVTVDDGDGNEVFRRGAVAVYDRASGKRLLEVHSDELTFDVEQGVVASNVVELPYGRQSVVIYADFNFDGQKDLAIMDGQESCYHGPSFTVFLRTTRGFVTSPAFTRLAHEYCGMFSVDVVKRQLATMTKSGCCWHQFNTYAVVRSLPQVIQSTEESLTQFSPNYVEVKSTGQHPSHEYFLNAENTSRTEVLSFALAGNPEKRVKILLTENGLDYVLIAGERERVEFSYLLDVNGYRNDRKPREAPVPFTWFSHTQTLSFANGRYLYTVYDQQARLGVEVTTPQKKTFIAGVVASKRGSLEALGKATADNVVVK